MPKRVTPPPPRYGLALAIAIIVHCLILIGFSLQLHFASKPPSTPETSQIQASLISNNPASTRPTATVKPATPKKMPPVKPATNKETPPIKQPPEPKLPPVIPTPIASETAPTLEVKPEIKPVPTPKPLPPATPHHVANVKKESLKQALAEEIEHPVTADTKPTVADKQALNSALSSEIAAEVQHDAITSKNPGSASKTANAVKNPNATEVDRYKLLILQQIQQNWIVPQDVQHQSCELRVDVAPGGMVLKVSLLKTSGNDALDRSAIAAVNKSSPLPTPVNSTDFSAFRSFTITVKPEGSSFDEL